MEYRKEPKTGTIFNFESMCARYGKEMPDSGVLRRVFDEWEKVDVYYDSRTDTMLHIKRVAQLLSLAAGELLRRALIHDQSKLESPEKELFDDFTPRLAGCTYGSDEYKEFLKGLKVALDHHYSKNSHHPEHYEHGMNGFDLFDLIEMFFDWKAATERHHDGNIFKSIEINQKRFEYPDMIASIFRNTAKRLNF